MVGCPGLSPPRQTGHWPGRGAPSAPARFASYVLGCGSSRRTGCPLPPRNATGLGGAVSCRMRLQAVVLTQRYRGIALALGSAHVPGQRVRNSHSSRRVSALRRPVQRGRTARNRRQHARTIGVEMIVSGNAPGSGRPDLPSSMIRSLNILVTDAHELAGMGAIRSLGRAGHHITAAWSRTIGSEATSRPAATWSRFCRDAVTSPDPWQEQATYREWMQERVESGLFDVILPISEASIVALSTLREKGLACEKEPLLLMPSEAALTFALSKVEATRRALELGIPSPATVFIQSLKDFSEAANEVELGDRLATLRYPCLVKLDNALMPDGSYERGRGWTVSSAEEALRVMEGQAARASGAIIQEAVPGRGEGAFLLRHAGRVHLRFAHRRLHEVPWSGGRSSFRESIPGEELLESAERLLESIDYEGVAMIEFRRGAHDGRPYFLEINGRLWGSLALALHAGVDFPRALLECHLQGEPSETRTGRRIGLRCRNIFPGELLYLRSILRPQAPTANLQPPSRTAAIGEFIRLTFDPRIRHDYLWLSDPVPGLVQAGRATASLTRAAVKRIAHRVVKVRDGRVEARLLAEHRARRKLPRYFDSPLRRILFICYGNICRSPFAELYWNARRAEVEQANDPSTPCSGTPVATSAGTYPVAGRRSPDGIVEIAYRRGVDLRHHRSRLLVASAVQEADAIFVMDLHNYRDLLSRYPDVRSKTWLLGLFAGSDSAVIEDPYLMGADEALACCNGLIRALDGLLEQVESDRSAEPRARPPHDEAGAHV